MSGLIKAMNDNYRNDNVRTNNGALTNFTSGNANVDLFFTIGAARNADLSNAFDEAFNENSDYAIRNLLWARDVRKGAGERATFRKLFKQLIKTDVESAERVLNRLPELGRWDDVFVSIGTAIEPQALALIKKGFEAENGLLAKWMPRDTKNPVNKAVREYLGLYPAEFRKLIVRLSKTVEQQMSARQWGDIVYDHVPSVASARYQKAFTRHDPKRYAEYLAGVEKGERKINAKALYPYDVIRSMRSGNSKAADVQWNALPNYLEGNDERILAVIDVSGSMETRISGSVTAMDASIGLGIYLGERMEGPFKDHFITFTNNPKLIKLSGNTLKEKYNSVKAAGVGYDTNFVAVFEEVLSKARQYKVPQDEMPTKILVLSDMEFNQVDRGHTNFDKVKSLYEQYDYKMPTMVFWNLNGRERNNPVTVHDENTALVSGFSPSILTSVLGDGLSPEAVMLRTILDNRYDY